MVAGAMVALGAAACGSSSKTTSTSTKAGTTNHVAAAAKPQPVPGAATKAGAVSAKAAGLKKLAVVPKAAPFAPHIAGIDGTSTAQAIPVVAGDINKFWSQELSKSNVQLPAAQEALVQSSAVQNPCNGNSVAPTAPPNFCFQSSGGTFFWTVPWMQQNIDTDPGHVSLTFTMAQAWSLYVQYVFGYYSAVSTGKMPKAQFAEQNTCLTGVYVRSLADRQLLEKGDTQTANEWVSSVSASANGITAPDVSAAQLQSAFGTGFKTGDPTKCINGGAT